MERHVHSSCVSMSIPCDLHRPPLERLTSEGHYWSTKGHLSTNPHGVLCCPFPIKLIFGPIMLFFMLHFLINYASKKYQLCF